MPQPENSIASSYGNKPHAGKASSESSRKTGREGHWTLLLVEVVHLLALFFAHSRHAKGARASGVLYSQFIRYFDILSRMPCHDKTLILRRIRFENEKPAWQNNHYLIVYGDLAIHADRAFWESTNASKHLSGALKQAFHCLAGQGIQSLRVQWPGRSLVKNEQLHLALTIIARFYNAAEYSSSITLRYFGRDLTIPLIKYKGSDPDPNLTVTAALNSLSEINTREILKQAEAYSRLGLTSTSQNNGDHCVGGYEKLFSIRALRSQLIRPLVEMNTISMEEMTRRLSEKGFEIDTDPKSPPEVIHTEENGSNSLPLPLFDVYPSLSYNYVINLIGQEDPTLNRATALLFSTDYAALNHQRLAQRLFLLSQLIGVLEKNQTDGQIIEKVLRFLRDQLEHVHKDVLAALEIQTGRVKLLTPNGSVTLATVHPKLIDLVGLIEERLSTEKKLLVIDTMTLDLNRVQAEKWCKALRIDSHDIEQIVLSLRSSIDDNDTLIPDKFRQVFPGMTHHSNTLFEMLWHYLRQSSHQRQRIPLLDVLHIIAGQLSDPKQSVGFLMADIYGQPFEIALSDRNAFALVNVIICPKTTNMNRDNSRTPVAVLKCEKEVDRKARQYAAWRLDFDQIRVLTKLRTIYDAIVTVLHDNRQSPAPPARLMFLLSLLRESFIFYALSGGQTGGAILVDALAHYADPMADIYQFGDCRLILPKIIPLLQIALQGIGRIGSKKDLDSLKEFEHSANALKKLSTDPVHAKNVNQLLSLVAPTIKSIHLRGQ